MIPSLHKQGRDTARLLAYLYGPGRREEHTDPHLVGSFDHQAPDPGRNSGNTRADLARLLDEPLHLLPADARPAGHVWHASVRAAPEDRTLTDAEWADIARRVVAAAGIDPGDGAGCRWAAVRHADDHIHLVATLVREDGRRPRHHLSAKRAQTECRAIEKDYGLRRVRTGDGTAAKRPTPAEQHKAARRNRDRTPREDLRQAVRSAVAGACSDAEFFGRLSEAGLRVRTRVAPSGDVIGYTVAQPGDRNGKNEPIWYSGSKLAPDLSLPRIRARWAAPESTRRTGLPETNGPALARRRTMTAAWEALLVIDHGEDTIVAAHVAATGEVLDALAQTSAAHTRQELRAAATAYERASRSHIRAARGHSQALRRAARDLVHSGPAFGRGEEGAATAMALDMLVFLVTAAARWHAAKHHEQQAEAAHRAAEHLRAAYGTAAAAPLARLHKHGTALTLTQRRHHAATLHEALPDLADRVLAEPGWPALAATLDGVRRGGGDPRVLLRKAAVRRELDSAEHVSDVLVWRIRQLGALSADAPEVPARKTRRAASSTPPEGAPALAPAPSRTRHR